MYKNRGWKNNKQSKTITTTYNIPTQLSGSVHIALISDVHDRCSDAALSILHQQQPDLILVARWPDGTPWSGRQSLDGRADGWMAGNPAHPHLVFQYCAKIWWFRIIRRTNEALEQGKRLSFSGRSGKIAPVVLGVGNHEWYHTEEDLQFFKEHGVVFLDNRDCELTVKGQKLLIGGMSTRYDLEWLDQFSQKTVWRFWSAITRIIIRNISKTRIGIRLRWSWQVTLMADSGVCSAEAEGNVEFRFLHRDRDYSHAILTVSMTIWSSAQEFPIRRIFRVLGIPVRWLWFSWVEVQAIINDGKK